MGQLQAPAGKLMDSGCKRVWRVSE